MFTPYQKHLLKNLQKKSMTSYFDRNKARYQDKLRDIYNLNEDEEESEEDETETEDEAEEE